MLFDIFMIIFAKQYLIKFAMSVQIIASKLVEFCREGNYAAAHNELYAPNAISIEPKGSPVEIVEGIEAIKAKSKQFSELVEAYHKLEVSEPIVSSEYFAIIMKLDLTMKGVGRNLMEEVCVYRVKEEKIVSEQFFYSPRAMA